MDIFDIHNVKREKENAMLQYRRFRKIAKLFRLVELLLALILLSWISSRLPFVIKISGDYFRLLLSIIVSPLFIFLISNLIVLTLLLKSGQLSNNSTSMDNAGTELYHEIVNNATEDVRVPPVVEEIVYQDKQVITEQPEIAIQKETLPKSVPDLDLKTYRRSQSDNLFLNCFEKADKVVYCSKLKRSETEVGRRTVETPAAEENPVNVVDELSNEEFQRKIEGFIARQVRFHQEEKLAIVVPQNLL